MSQEQYSTREKGNRGENIACAYLERHGFTILERNVARKTGELDIVARRNEIVHIIEVKALVCREPVGRVAHSHSVPAGDMYHPAFNLHADKLRKVARTAEWYLKDIGWMGEWQIDAVFLWLCPKQMLAHAEYLPHIE